jgi:hypothetical protein
MQRFVPVFAALVWTWAPCGIAQVRPAPATLAQETPAQAARASGTSSKAAPDLAGVYQSIPNGTVLAGGLRNSGSPAEISLLPKAAAQAKAIDLKDDPARTCSPVGEFRLMARDGVKIELAPGTGLLAMLYENAALGAMRIIYMNRGHVAPPTEGPEPVMETGGLWLGDSIGRWEGDTLLVDTSGFNARTWLNDAGAQHSDALHLIERIRPIQGGHYLEYKMTAEDPKTLARPYTYTRYFKKLDTEFEDEICVDEQ